jgi:hypothetical protein
MITIPLALEWIDALVPIVVSGRSVAALESLVTRLAVPLLGTINGLSVERSQASDRTKGPLQAHLSASSTSIPYGNILCGVREENWSEYGKDGLIRRYLIVVIGSVTTIGNDVGL